jgi:hypothetical protein
MQIARFSSGVIWFEPWFCHLEIHLLLPFLYRKPEALATTTNSEDSKPFAEKEYLKENESVLS